MNIKLLNFPQKRFHFEKSFLTEYSVEIFASNSNDSNEWISIFIDGLIHFQITDESYKVKLVSKFRKIAKKENNSFESVYFFEVLSPEYTNWLSDESYGFFQKDFYRYYILFFSDSVIEIISSEEPVLNIQP